MKILFNDEGLRTVRLSQQLAKTVNPTLTPREMLVNAIGDVTILNRINFKKSRELEDNVIA